MKYTYDNLNYDKLWSPSGDPFVDAGGFALKKLSNKFPDKDILELIDFATEIYVNRWNSKINTFFLNSNITQPAFDAEKKILETHKYFTNILLGTSESIKGCCRILGIESDLYPSGRNTSVLSGSGTFANFHHSFESGIMLSKEAMIRYHFLPLATELLQGNVCVISSSQTSTSEYYVSSVLSRTLMNIGQNKSDSVLKNEAKAVGTAIFKFVDNVLADCTNENKFESISLYSFTNFGASPDLTIYTLPFQAFFFYRESQKSKHKDIWNNFVRHYYRTSEIKGAKYDEDTQTYKGNNKKQEVTIGAEEYKSWRNIIFEKLLNNISLVDDIRFWSIKNVFSLELFNIYLYNIRKMKIETINKINEIADFILANTQETEIKKVITNLNGIKSASLLRRFILKVVEKNYTLGNETTIVTVKEYTDYLFPETSSWMEIRDVLLIDIYQKLHERQVKVDTDEIDFELTDDEN